MNVFNNGWRHPLFMWCNDGVLNFEWHFGTVGKGDVEIISYSVDPVEGATALLCGPGGRDGCVEGPEAGNALARWLTERASPEPCATRGDASKGDG